VEGRNFEIRKRLLEYDDVMNQQREEIYRLRRDILEGKEGRAYLMEISGDVLDSILEEHCPPKSDPDDWTLSELTTDILAYYNINVHDAGIKLDEMTVDEMREDLRQRIEGKYAGKEERHGEEVIRMMERAVMLQVVDSAWKDHLLALDHLKEGVGLRGYGQRDPLNEYKRESFELFSEMRNRIEDTIIKNLYRLEPASPEEMAEQQRKRREAARRALNFSAPAKTSGPPQAVQTVVNKGAKVGRNDPCPCGSGKKYKKCHGAPTAVGV
jgi:preprotein translocase subunit SecA